jgi:hypothetical protein
MLFDCWLFPNPLFYHWLEMQHGENLCIKHKVTIQILYGLMKSLFLGFKTKQNFVWTKAFSSIFWYWIFGFFPGKNTKNIWNYFFNPFFCWNKSLVWSIHKMKFIIDLELTWKWPCVFFTRNSKIGQFFVHFIGDCQNLMVISSLSGY